MIHIMLTQITTAMLLTLRACTRLCIPDRYGLVPTYLTAQAVNCGLQSTVHGAHNQIQLAKRLSASQSNSTQDSSSVSCISSNGLSVTFTESADIPSCALRQPGLWPHNRSTTKPIVLRHACKMAAKHNMPVGLLMCLFICSSSLTALLCLSQLLLELLGCCLAGQEVLALLRLCYTADHHLQQAHLVVQIVQHAGICRDNNIGQRTYVKTWMTRFQDFIRGADSRQRTPLGCNLVSNM